VHASRAAARAPAPREAFHPHFDSEVALIRAAAVDAAGGNLSEAAKRLGMSRNTIYRKLR
jgi:transcriptional regulator of acetoin/glycerol metabolism